MDFFRYVQAKSERRLDVLDGDHGAVEKQLYASSSSALNVFSENFYLDQSVNLDDLFRPLNRIVLCQLSRSCRTISGMFFQLALTVDFFYVVLFFQSKRLFF